MEMYNISFDSKIKDYTPVVEKIIRTCKDNTVISLSEGSYYFSRKIEIENISNLTIKGNNSVIISEFDPKYGFEKYSGVFSFRNSKNIKIEGLIFDTSKPINSVCKVISIDHQNYSIEVEVCENCVLDGNQTIFATNSIDEDGSFDYRMSSYKQMDYEVIAEKRVRIYCTENYKESLQKINVGTKLCLRYGIGGYNVLPNAMLTFYNCDDTSLYDITIHSSPGYALVVFPRCNNFTIDGYRVFCPENSGRVMASNVDGIHVLGLHGKLIMRNCYFNGLGDDALNIHSTAGYITEKSENCISLQYKRFSIPLSKDWCRKGDKIAVYDSDFLRKATLTVDKYEDSKVFYSVCEGEVEAGCFVANTAFYAQTEVENCEVRNTRARAFVFQTENISVKNCRFFGLSCAAILMAPDVKVWHEMGPVKNVRIENCLFEKCSILSRLSQKSAIVVRAAHDEATVYPTGVHENISICNNRFLSIPGETVCIASTDGVKLSGNVRDEEQQADYKFINCINVSKD